MALSLRSYQRKALDNIEEAEKRGVRRLLVVHPTGTGKTVTFSHAAKERADRGRIVALVHRGELASQTRNKMAMVAPELSTGIVKAGINELDADVVIASVQTVSRDRRLAELIESGRRSPFGTIIVDEAHHAPAPTWTKVLAGLGSFNPYGPLTIGFTATPERKKGKTLGVWEEVVSYMSIREAIYGNGKKGRDGHEGGFIVPILPAVVVETQMDLDRVRKTGGDLSEGDLGREMESSGAVDQIADAYVAHALDRKAVAFTPTVATAHSLAAALVARGVAAEAIDGTTDSEVRRLVLQRLKSGQTRVVVNCAVLTEGFDEPSISCVIVARPTSEHGLYVQMVGRGTRLYPGKKDLLVIDVVGASVRHELVGVVDLGLDLDESKKRKEPGEKRLCPMCQDTCSEATHRCALCRRYLPLGAILNQYTRHENCGSTTSGPVDVFGQSRMRWLPVGDAQVLGAGEEVVVMVPVGLDVWKLATYRQGRVQTLHEEIPGDWAMGIGEDRAKAFVKLVERSARWLDDPVTPAQKSRLVREGLPESTLPKVRTRGQAADLLTRIQGRRAIKKMVD